MTLYHETAMHIASFLLGNLDRCKVSIDFKRLAASVTNLYCTSSMWMTTLSGCMAQLRSERYLSCSYIRLIIASFLTGSIEPFQIFGKKAKTNAADGLSLSRACTRWMITLREPLNNLNECHQWHWCNVANSSLLTSDDEDSGE
jgi:hypothetical protein